jgi:hypothetical protein
VGGGGVGGGSMGQWGMCVRSCTDTDIDRDIGARAISHTRPHTRARPPAISCRRDRPPGCVPPGSVPVRARGELESSPTQTASPMTSLSIPNRR